MSDLTNFFDGIGFYWGLLSVPFLAILASSHCLIVGIFSYFLIKKSAARSKNKIAPILLSVLLFFLFILLMQHLELGSSDSGNQNKANILCLPF